MSLLWIELRTNGYNIIQEDFICWLDWVVEIFSPQKSPSLESIGSHMHYISLMYPSVKSNRKTNFLCVWEVMISFLVSKTFWE